MDWQEIDGEFVFDCVAKGSQLGVSRKMRALVCLCLSFQKNGRRRRFRSHVKANSDIKSIDMVGHDFDCLLVVLVLKTFYD